MATYTFSSITEAQAVAITGADTLFIDVGTATGATVIFHPFDGGPSRVTLTAGNSSALFSGAGLAAATKFYPDGSTLFVGTSSNDGPIFAGAGNDALFGGDGIDILAGGDGSDLLQGNQGQDNLSGGAGADTLYGGADNDRIDAGAGASGGFGNFGQGNRGDDSITGSRLDNDTILGGQGNDLIGAASLPPVNADGILYPTGLTGGGNDFLNGNLGNDTIIGGTGSDTLNGEDGDDVIIDGGGDRVLILQDSGFVDVPGGGLDSINAGAGNDTVIAAGGNAYVAFGDGNDFGGVMGRGFAGGSATLDGGAGIDRLHGGLGDDLLLGGGGNDALRGWQGADTLTGGPGSDQFQISASSSIATVQSTLDRITDWDGEQDRLVFFSDAGLPSTPGTSINYREVSVLDYDAALTLATASLNDPFVAYIAIQLNADVYVFAERAGAVILVGRTLADITFGNIEGEPR